MQYEVKMIADSRELDSCNIFRINNLLWGTTQIPATYGKLGFVPEDGFYLSCTCEEPDPLRRYTQDQDPVCNDSAVEMFIQFYPGTDGRSGYFNFEMNANGALHAKYGITRSRRIPLPIHEANACSCRGTITDSGWNIILRIPLSVLRIHITDLSLQKGDTFACNFYKISECPDIEHYASFAPVGTSCPDFHRPEYFAEAVLV